MCHGIKTKSNIGKLAMDYFFDMVSPTNLHKKYADHLIISTKMSEMESLLSKFNSGTVDNTIEFTIERENNEKWVSFLDTKVIRTTDHCIILDSQARQRGSALWTPFIDR